MNLRALSLILALLPPAAAAQQFPVVSDHTVLGRIGTGTSSGPAQAIPFSSFLPTIVGSQAKNTVFAGPSSGVNAAPAFRALVGADLPAPGASSLGGVESLTCSSSNWFNTLSTAGVFGCSQPNFSDLLGTVATAQIAANAVTNAKLAAMNAWTFKANNSGSSAAPTDVTIDGLTAKASPATSDEVPIWDAASSAMKKATLGTVVALATSGITPVKLETLSPSNVASISTSASWNGYSSIEIRFSNVIPATNSVNLLLQLTCGTLQTTGYATQVLNVSSTTVAGALGPTTAFELAPAIPNTASAGSTGIFRIGGVATANNKQGVGQSFNSGPEYSSLGGVLATSTACTAGTFAMSSGNISSGSIEIWGTP